MFPAISASFEIETYKMDALKNGSHDKQNILILRIIVLLVNWIVVTG